MNRVEKIILSVVVMSMFSSYSYAHTLTAAVEKALQTNPEILSAQAALKVSEEQLNSARAGYLPTIDLSLTAGEENMAKPASAVTDMWKQDHSITLTQKLFDGGTTDSTVERSEEMFKQAEIRHNDLTGTITLNVMESWYELYKLQRIAQMIQRNVAQHQQLFSQTQQKVKVGAAAKAELTAVEGPYIGALTAQAANSGQLSDAIARYTKVVGERPEGMLPNPETILATAQLPATVDDAVTQALSVTAGVLTAESNLLAANADHRGSKAGMLPTIDFEFTELLKNDASGTDGTEYGWTALLKMSYNLYKGGADEARRRETAQALVDSREQLVLAQRTAEEQIRVSWSALQVSQRILGLNQQKLKTAMETLQSTREQFKLGEVEMIAVMGAEDALFQAQQAVLTERVTGTLARFRLLNQLDLLRLTPSHAEVVEEKEPAEASSDQSIEVDQETAESDLIDRVIGQSSGVIQQIEGLLSTPSSSVNGLELLPSAVIGGSVKQSSGQDISQQAVDQQYQPEPLLELPSVQKASVEQVDDGMNNTHSSLITPLENLEADSDDATIVELMDWVMDHSNRVVEQLEQVFDQKSLLPITLDFEYADLFSS